MKCAATDFWLSLKTNKCLCHMQKTPEVNKESTLKPEIQHSKAQGLQKEIGWVKGRRD